MMFAIGFGLGSLITAMIYNFSNARRELEYSRKEKTQATSNQITIAYNMGYQNGFTDAKSMGEGYGDAPILPN